MSKLMFIFGILFLAAGVALGFLIHFSPGEMQVRGLTPDVSAILIVGGALCLGLGSTIGGPSRPDRCNGCGRRHNRDARGKTRNAKIYWLWQKGRGHGGGG